MPFFTRQPSSTAGDLALGAFDMAIMTNARLLKQLVVLFMNAYVWFMHYFLRISTIVVQTYHIRKLGVEISGGHARMLPIMCLVCNNAYIKFWYLSKDGWSLKFMLLLVGQVILTVLLHCCKTLFKALKITNYNIIQHMWLAHTLQFIVNRHSCSLPPCFFHNADFVSF